MSRSLKIVLIIAVLAGTGILIFTASDTSNPTEDTTAPATSTNSTVSVPNDWETYSNAQYDFSIAHPPEATVQAEGAGEQNHIKFTYLGSEQATGEITDGFTLTVSSYDQAADQTLEEFAQQRLEENLQAGDEVAPVQEATFNGRSAYTFSTENLGVVEHIVVENDDAYIVTSSNIADPNNQGYDEMISLMKGSLELREISSNEGEQSTTSQVSLALLDPDVSEGEEPDRGCDMIEMVNRNIEETETPLTAAMNELFALEREEVQGFRNFMARTNDTLSFDRAEVADGTANIYLEGELSGLVGVCDDPRAKAQIEETALQFATVENVQIYLNEEPTDLLPPSPGPAN